MLSRARRVLAPAGVLLAAACSGGAVPPAATSPEPAAPPAAGPAEPPPPRPPARRPRLAPPQVAAQLGLMPLASTGVSTWRLRRPQADGRGVLIGILDSGVDPGVAGLTTTSTGEPKILDLRDFSDEGLVALRAEGDRWVGSLRELAFGVAPEADLNGDGDNSDAFAVEVRREDGALAARIDLNGDGSLDDEAWMRDYAAARETFTFSSRWVPRGRGPVTAALNLSEQSGTPRLVVYFDNSGHGTHVAGIAAGSAIYGQSGLDGVAPGAQILGLKIANNLRGGVSTTGSMIHAMEYAAAFARERNMPLVLNMSFGVGNSQPGRAVMDSIVNAFLLAHPDVFFSISAGNEGPGSNTMGEPGSAALALSVGATYPGALAALQFGSEGDVLGWWSSRGGQTAKPDLLTPGLAYSTVPAWNSGDEIKGGTSMAAPHAAGLAALLISAARAAGMDAPGRAAIVQALRATARPFADVPASDQGAGLADIDAAWQWLRAGHEVVGYHVDAMASGPARPGGPMPSNDDAPAVRRRPRPEAAWRADGLASAADTVQRFRVSVMPGAPRRARHYRLVSDAAWLRPATSEVTVDSATGSAVVELRYAGDRLRAPGRYAGAVRGIPVADSAAGPAFTLVNTVLVPEPEPRVSFDGTVPRGATRRWYLRVPDGAAGLRVHVTVPDTTVLGSLSLFEPTSRPARDGNEAAIGGEAGTSAEITVSAEDLPGGTWEIVFQAMPGRDAPVRLEAAVAPVELRVSAQAGDVRVAASATAGSLGGSSLAWIGADTALTVTFSELWRREFRAPAWASGITVEVEVSPEAWNEVTDLAISLFDSTGARLENGAMNFPFNRVHTDLPEHHPDGYRVALELFPGFARPVPSAMMATVRVRFEPAEDVVLGLEEGVLTGASLRTQVSHAVPAGWASVLRARAWTTAGESDAAERLVRVTP